MTQGAYIQAWIPKKLKVRFKSCAASEDGGMTAVLKRLISEYCDGQDREVSDE